MTVLNSIRTLATTCSLALMATALPSAVGQSPLFLGNGAAETGTSAGPINPVQNGLFLQGKDTYRVVDTAGFRTAADIGQSQAGSVAQVGFGVGCSSCGTSNCGGGCGPVSGCGSCGTAGYGGYGGGFGDACPTCVPYRYASVEALYMDNDSVGNFSLSPNFRVGEFEHEFGSRITVGSVSDCVHGYEFTFVGPFEWDRFRSVASPGGGIATTLLPGAGVELLDMSSFADFSEFLPVVAESDPDVIFNADQQNQRYRAEYWSLEANRTLVAGEFAKLLIGTRYVNYEELYAYNSRSTGIDDRAERPFVPANPITGAPAIPFREAIPGRAASSGQLRSDVDNDLFGLQIGIDLLYPVCCYGYTDLRARAGGFINSAQNQFLFANAIGTADQFLIGFSDSSTGLAGLFELGAGFRYQLGEILTVRAGTELWYITEVATASSQFSNTISTTTGRRVRNSDDVLMTGISVGAELKF